MFLLLLPTATERQRKNSVHRKKRVSLSFGARWFQGAIPGRLTIFFLSGGRNYTVILLPHHPLYFLVVFIDEEMQSKKLGAISLVEFLWIFPLYLFDCSRGVATNYYWRLMALEKNVLLSLLGSFINFWDRGSLFIFLTSAIWLSLWANWSGVYFLDAGWSWGGRNVCSQCHDELPRFLCVLVS